MARTPARADRARGFRRIVGNDERGAIYFLPWRTSFRTAMKYGLLGLERWRLCYELPTDIVAADPEQCANAIRSVVDDAADEIEHRHPSALVGLSIGSVPATMLAGRYHTELWSFASADRGDLMIWQSPAAQKVRREAEARGWTLGDYTRALRGLNPIDWLDRINPQSRFSVGMFDRTIPRARRGGLLRRAATTVPKDNVSVEPVGHLGVIALSPWRQRQWQRQQQLKRRSRP